MKITSTKDLKVKFLGITPVFKDKTGVLNSQEIVALSALLTFKGKSIKNLLKDSLKKGEKLEKKIQNLLRKSSLRGHASIATTPTLCIAFEGSKFLDSALTGIIFSSSLVSSGRRTDTTEKDIIYPTQIIKNSKAKKAYYQVSKEIIDTLNYLLAEGVKKDEASKLLQYGIYGTGIIQLPVESIISLKREYENEKDWMPEEVGMLLKKIEKKSKELGIDWLYATRDVAPRNTYPYPNIFKNPANINITRELMQKEKLVGGTKLVSMDLLITPELKKKFIILQQKTKETVGSLKKIKKEWFNNLLMRREIARDYNSALHVRILSSIPWRVWGEKKRHRTVPMVIESLYYCTERTANVFKKFQKQIKKGNINKKTVSEIDKYFSIPPTIKNNPEFLQRYLLAALNSFNCYTKLIRMGVKPSSAIFIIPRAVRLDVLQEYDLYNLLTGYYPLRLCQTAEEEMRRFSVKETQQIKKALSKKGLDWLAKFMVPKCEIASFCPEEKSCGSIKSLVKDYNDKFHQEMKDDLEKRFQKSLKKLGK